MGSPVVGSKVSLISRQGHLVDPMLFTCSGLARQKTVRQAEIPQDAEENENEADIHLPQDNPSVVRGSSAKFPFVQVPR